MKRREFLQLAHTYDPAKHGVGGWYVSEKLDGMRAYWDGGFTQGKLTSQIPFANTTKDYRRITPPYSTGLWSRYGKPIAAPRWFTDGLPQGIPLDGELYLGRKTFQTLMSTVKKFEPVDGEWDSVKFMVFDIPPDEFMFMDGRISVPSWKEELELFGYAPAGRTKLLNFEWTLGKLAGLPLVPEWNMHEQERLPMQTDKAEARIEELLDEVQAEGGEGLVLRNPAGIWHPTRSHNLLKVKKCLDSEALVTGYVWGKGKLEGLMGALVVSWRGKTFELSGFTEAERVLSDRFEGGGRVNNGEPGTKVERTVHNAMFPCPSLVSFKYRELSDAGIPKEARYWRKS